MILSDDIKTRISIRSSRGLFFIDKESIIRIEADGSYCNVYLTNGTKQTVSKPLCRIEKLLNSSNYFRTHHSHLVNSNHIVMLQYEDGGYLQMSDGSQVPIARRRRRNLISYMSCTA